MDLHLTSLDATDEDFNFVPEMGRGETKKCVGAGKYAYAVPILLLTMLVIEGIIYLGGGRNDMPPIV